MSVQHAQYVTIFSTGGKFQLVPNFTGLHALTLAARSYAFLMKVCGVSAQLGTWGASRDCISTRIAHGLGNLRIIPFLSIIEQAAASILMKVFPKHTHSLVSVGRVRGILM